MQGGVRVCKRQEEVEEVVGVRDCSYKNIKRGLLLLLNLQMSAVHQRSVSQQRVSPLNQLSCYYFSGGERERAGGGEGWDIKEAAASSILSPAAREDH